MIYSFDDIVCDDVRVKPFWEYIIYRNRDNLLTRINVSSEDKFVGGFYTNMKRLNVIQVNCAAIIDGKLQTDNKEALAILIHEYSHYDHLFIDDGVYEYGERAQFIFNGDNYNIEKKFESEIAFCELEAWYRSLGFNSVFGLNLEDEINKVNSTNMNIVMGIKEKKYKKTYNFFKKNLDKGL